MVDIGWSGADLWGMTFCWLKKEHFGIERITLKLKKKKKKDGGGGRRVRKKMHQKHERKKIQYPRNTKGSSV